MKYCALPAKSEDKTLDNFKTYNEAILQHAFDYSQNLADRSGDIIFLTLVAESDRGKSHLGIAICRRWLERKEAARYCNVARLLNDLRDGLDREGEASYRSKLNFYCTVGLLVLDDFGTERITEWGAEQLQTIINVRYEDARYTVVTSNRPVDDLFNLHDHPKDDWRDLANMRIESRLQRESWCRVLVLDTKRHMDR